MTDLHEVRKRVTQLHDELRGEGLNPIEALALLGVRLEELKDLMGLIEHPADLVSSIYQEILTPEARNGLGQYLTPLPVATMMATVANKLSAGRDILDPFCGVGLLLNCVASLKPDARLFGIEISEPAAQMATVLSEISGTPIQLELGNTFECLSDSKFSLVDIVITNPPFGATATTDTVNTECLPESLKRLSKLPAELLGLEVSIRRLKHFGLLAVVLPQSVLTNRGWDDYRVDIFSRLRVHAAVSLPEETFGPYKGVANACVLLAIRSDGPVQQTFPMYVSQSVGYSSTGRSNGISDLNDIATSILNNEEADRQVKVTATGQVYITTTEMRDDDTIKLGDIAEIFVGKNPSRDHYIADGPWLLKVGDLAGSVIPWRTRPKNRVSPEWFYKHSHRHLRVGDVCLTAAAHRPKYIGLKVDLVDAVPPEGALPSGEVMVIRLHSEVNIDPEQLLFYLRSNQGYQSIQEQVRGSTGHLYADDVVDMLIPELSNRYPGTAIVAYRQAVKHYRKYRRKEMEALEVVTPHS